MASGLAGKVRRSTESDEFDLSGYDQARCNELAKACFGEPFPLKEMVRISFVVGGGKLVRQKYSDDLPKFMVNALGAIGFQEDNSATVEAGSAGKFKYHHDTNKNLKFVHVFPKIAEAPAPEQQADEGLAGPRVLKTPEELLLESEEADFTRFLQTHLVTYAQKRKALELLKQRIAVLEEIELKLSRLERLSDEEQQLFEGIGSEDLRQKVKQVNLELQAMVEANRLSSAEKSDCLEELESKMAQVQEEIAKAEAEGKAKKVQALAKPLEVLKSTHLQVKAADPVSLPPLKNGDKIRQLRQKLGELERLEKATKTKGHASIDELKRLGERPELEEAALELERRARGWLESDEVFEQRLEANLRVGRAAPRGAGGYNVVSGGAKPATAKAKSTGTRNAFGALG
ncbi:unnamed protein product [Cladocopium goreaui]|uniref:Uncharacterized protein n=1 Tax=Cladocopium goreaui TaxID=2562237 RepID=A0A9P1CYP9_9DINO|nr:unnamed protein product [Cladocopium goreaui]